jgi:hypothetical protein
VRRGGVAYLVDAVHDGVECRVIADSRVGAEEVVVDGAGEADYGEVEFVGEDARSGERAVAADDHKGVDLMALHHVVCQLASFWCLKFFTTGSLQYRAAHLNDV